MPRPIKQKTHKFLLTMRTDKPCTKNVAIREARYIIHGKYFVCPVDNDDPETMRVVSINHLSAK